jgi:hypothetical protein
MNAYKEQLAKLTAEFEMDLKYGAKAADMEPIVVACIGLSTLTLDLIWTLQWLNTLKDKRTDEGIVDEFMTELKQRCENSHTLKLSAQEANLL